jgi:hypothetical protein
VSHMTHYFFDFRANGRLSLDEEGVELLDVDAAHDQALGALIDIARDAVMEGKSSQKFSVQVRDGIGPVLEVTGVFGSRILRKQ